MFSFVRWAFGHSTNKCQRGPARLPRRWRSSLHLEALEERLVPADWTGVIPDGTVWNSTEVHRVLADATVPAGATLTIQPGAVVKFESSTSLIVDGTLSADGAAGQTIVFTSYLDDSAGGDTNGDGDSSGLSGDWGSLKFSATSTGNLLDHVDVRFGGGSAAALLVEGGDLTLRDSTLRASFREGLRIVNGTAAVSGSTFRDGFGGSGIRIEGSSPTITDCTFLNNGVANFSAALSMDLLSAPVITGATVAGNGVNALQLDGGTLPGSAAWDDPDVVYYFDSDITVPQGATLTVAAGQVVKAPSGSLLVEGRLLTNGTAARPVIFTARSDDSAGGDTENGGPSSGQGGWFGGLVFTPTSSGSVLEHTEVRFGGGFEGDVLVLVRGADLTLRDSAVRNAGRTGLGVEDGDVVVTRSAFADNFIHGLHLIDSTAAVSASVFSGNFAGAGVRIEGSNPTLTDCHFADNHFTALSTDLASDPSVVRPTFANNGINGLRLDGGSLPNAVTRWDDPDVVYWVTVGASITVPQGASLSISPGQVVKFGRVDGSPGSFSNLTVEGQLLAQGAAGRPVVFTSWSDDTAGGDTDNSGPSTGEFGWIGGVVLTPTSTGSVLDRVELRLGTGSQDGGLLRQTGGDLVLRNSVIRDTFAEGVVFLDGATTRIENSIVAGHHVGIRVENAQLTAINNTVDSNVFAGVHVVGGTAAVTLVNNLITFTDVRPGFRAGIRVEGGASVTARFNNVFTPDTDEASDGEYVGLPDLTGTDGNISVDPLYLDREDRQYRLGGGSPAIDAASSGDAPATDLFGNPRFDDPDVVNRGGGAVPFVDLGALERQVPSSAIEIDLTTTQVSGPAAGVQDGTATVAWTVRNVGTVEAVGAWNDAVYLSVDRVLTPDDVLLGQFRHRGGLGVGASSSTSATVTLPGMLPGNYYFLVRANADLGTFEGRALANNVGAAAEPIALDLPALTLGVPLHGTLPADGAVKFYKVDVPAGADLGVTLTGQARAANELFLKFGDLPSRQSFDVRGNFITSADQSVAVGSTRGGTYYVMVRGNFLTFIQPFTLTATLRDFALLGVGPARGSNTGRVTLTLEGARFTPDSQVRLVDGAGVTVEAVAVYFDNSRRLHATFDLAGRSVGLADVQVVNPGGAAVTLADGFEIFAGQGGWLTTSLTTQGGENRFGRPFPLWVDYANEGDTDLPAPVLRLRWKDEVGIVFQEEIGGGPRHVDLVGFNPVGPAGVLPPGARGRFTLVGLAQEEGRIEFALDVAEYPDVAIDWVSLGAAIRPDAIEDDEWAAVLAALEANIGPSWDDYAAAIADAASLLAPTAGLNYSLDDVFQIQVDAARALAFPSVAGRLARAGDNLPLGGVAITLFDAESGEGATTFSHTDGSFVFPDVRPGTYDVTVVGFVTAAPLRLTVGAAGLANVRLEVVPGASLAGSVLLDSNGMPLRDVIVSAVSADGASYVATTDRNGRYTIDSLPAGVYEVRAGGGLHTRQVIGGFDLAQGEVVHSVNLLLSRAGAIRGVVSGPNGPLADALVTAVGPDGAGAAALTTATGEYTLDGLPGQSYAVSVSAAGFFTESFAGVTLVSGAGVDGVDFALERSGGIAGVVQLLGAGVSNATITLARAGQVSTEASDANGLYAFAELAPGVYTVTATSATHMTRSANVTVVAGATATQALDVSPRGSVAGTVTDSLSGQPLKKVIVHAVDADGTFVTGTITDDDGDYRLSGFEAGTYTVIVGDLATPGVARGSVTFDATHTSTTADFSTAVAGLVTGVVRLPDGTPILDARVALIQDGTVIAQMGVEADGRYTFVLVSAGVYQLEATADGRVFAARSGVAVSGGAVTSGLDFVADEEVLRGRVVDAATGMPLADAVVSLQGLEGGALLAGVVLTTDAEGRFAFTGAIPGNYRVRADAAGHAVTTTTATVSAGQPTEVVLTLADDFTLVGTVTDTQTGLALAEAALILTSANDATLVASASTDAAGAYTFDRLAAGVYHLVVMAEGRQTTVLRNLTLSQTAQVQNVTLSASVVEVSGAVTAALGPLRGATITVRDADGLFVARTQTTADGSYSLDQLAPGSYTLTASAGGYGSSAPLSLTVNAGANQTGQDFTLTAVGLSDATFNIPQDAAKNILLPLRLAKEPPGRLYELDQRDRDLLSADLTGENCSDCVDLQLFVVFREQHVRAKYQELLALFSAAHAAREQFLGANREFLAGLTDVSQGLTNLNDYLYRDVVESGPLTTAAYLAQLPLRTAVVVLVRSLQGLQTAFFTLGSNLFNNVKEPQLSENIAAVRATVNEFRKRLEEFRQRMEELPSRTIVTVQDRATLNTVEAALNGLNVKVTPFDDGMKALRLNALPYFQKYDEYAQEVIQFVNLMNLNKEIAAELGCFVRVGSLAEGDDHAGQAHLASQQVSSHDSCKPPRKPESPAVENAPSSYVSSTALLLVGRSIDPNDKTGPAGVGAAGFIRPVAFPYLVQFENDPDLGATAAAQIVVVTDTLDIDLDLTTVEFTEFGFGDFRFTVPPGLSHYETTLDLRPDGIELLVPVTLDVNFGTRVLTARFESLDPLTFLPPDGIADGFLPVNDATGRGEGFFRYTVRPHSGLPSGTRIRNFAAIVFDDNEPIVTPETLNTLDVAAPTSGVQALPATTGATAFLLNWSGADDANGSGLASYDVFVSTDGGPFVAFREGTTATTGVFRGAAGHTYAFYSTAVDRVGHRQSVPAQPQAVTQMIVANTTTTLKVPTSADAGAAVKLIATVKRRPGAGGRLGGTVTFADGDTVLGSAPLRSVNGVFQAKLTTTALGIGSRTITAFYGGSGTLTTSASAARQVRLFSPTRVALSSSAPTSARGSAVTFTAAVTATATAAGAGVPGGTVAFFDTFNGARRLLGTVAVDPETGVATLTTKALPRGAHIISARFTPTAGTDFRKSSLGGIRQTIQVAALRDSDPNAALTDGVEPRWPEYLIDALFASRR